MKFINLEKNNFCSASFGKKFESYFREKFLVYFFSIKELKNYNNSK